MHPRPPSAESKIYTCLFASQGRDLRDHLCAGASDDDLGDLVTGFWNRRVDRYSEEWAELARLQNGDRKIEMYQIHG